MTYPVTTCSIDGRLEWTLEPDTGKLTGLLPNGWKLEMHAIDTHRLLKLLSEYEEAIARESDKLFYKIGEVKRPLV